LPMEQSIQFSLSIWAIGLVISQTILRRNLLHALYLTGLHSAAAVAFLAVQTGLASLGVWLPLSLLLATTVYYALTVCGEFVRLGGSGALERGFKLSVLSP